MIHCIHRHQQQQTMPLDKHKQLLTVLSRILNLASMFPSTRAYLNLLFSLIYLFIHKVITVLSCIPSSSPTMSSISIRETPAQRDSYPCMTCFRSALGASADMLAKAKPTDDIRKSIKPTCFFKDAGKTQCTLCLAYEMNCTL